MHIGLVGGIGVAASVVYYQRLAAAMEAKGAKLRMTLSRGYPYADQEQPCRYPRAAGPHLCRSDRRAEKCGGRSGRADLAWRTLLF